MRSSPGPPALLIALPLLLTGCGQVDATAERPVNATSTAPSRAHSPGMSMAPGESMAGMAPISGPTSTAPAGKPPVNADATAPPKAAAMICEPETAKNVATLMGLRTPAPTKTSWADHLYTCTYRLAAGPLVLSVKQSPDPAAARKYFSSLRGRLGHTRPVTGLAGLGLPAYENTTGAVVFLKDNMTLKVDATALPSLVGPHKTTRADLAYTVATDVLACWSGDE